MAELLGGFTPLLIDSVENRGVRLVEARMFYVPIYSYITVSKISNCLRYIVNIFHRIHIHI